MSLDIEIGGASMDLSTDLGFSHALYHCANMKPGSGALAAPVCGSFVFMLPGGKTAKVSSDIFFLYQPSVFTPHNSIVCFALSLAKVTGQHWPVKGKAYGIPTIKKRSNGKFVVCQDFDFVAGAGSSRLLVHSRTTGIKFDAISCTFPKASQAGEGASICYQNV